MIDRELDIVVSRHAPGICGCYWVGEIQPAEPSQETPRGIASILLPLANKETTETPWSRVDSDSPFLPALAAGLVRLASATYHDGGVAYFARRVHV